MWNLLPNERLRWWQNFRKEISALDFQECLDKVEHLWSFAPFVNHYLTTDDLTKWPDPWELIYENTYCNLAKALGIVYTVWLSDHKTDLEIRIYKDQNTKEIYNLVWIDKGKYVLNYQHDKVVNKKHIDKNLELIKVITTDQLDLEKIR
jgi:hypothetical protein